MQKQDVFATYIKQQQHLQEQLQELVDNEAKLRKDIQAVEDDIYCLAHAAEQLAPKDAERAFQIRQEIQRLRTRKLELTETLKRSKNH